jgi:peroxiredoxin
VWATWCGPCAEEFHEFVTTQRKFGLRDFEFISISMDDPKTLAEVKTFLEEKNAIVHDRLKPSLKAEGRKGNAYVFEGASHDELIKALDPEWPGPIPHTILVAPGGEIVFRHNGEINGEELRAKILEILGHYWVPETK